jgi:hypothetical protein
MIHFKNTTKFINYYINVNQYTLCVYLSPEEKFEDRNGAIKSMNRKGTANRMVKRKRTNNDIQNTTQKYKYQTARIPLKT